MKLPAHILLDTEVFRRENLNFQSIRLRRLATHAQEGNVYIYITDIILGELLNSIHRAIQEALQHLKSKPVRRTLEILSRSKFAGLEGAMEKHNLQSLVDEQEGFLHRLLKDMKATTLSTDDVDVAELRKRYFQCLPPFGNSDAKKHEFPDALTIIRAESFAQQLPTPLYVISADKGIYKAVEVVDQLEPIANLRTAVSKIVEATQDTSWQSKRALGLIIKDIAASVREAFSDSWFYLEDEWDGEVEDVSVGNVDIGEPTIAEANDDAVVFEFIASIDFTASVKVPDPDQSAYDSETKEVYVFDYLCRKVETTVDIEGTVTIRIDWHDLAKSQIIRTDLFESSIGVHFPW